MKKYVFLTISILLSLLQINSKLQAAEQVNCAGCKTEYYLIKELTDSLNNELTDINIKPAKTGNKKAVELMIDGKVNFAFTCKNHLNLLRN